LISNRSKKSDNLISNLDFKAFGFKSYPIDIKQSRLVMMTAWIKVIVAILMQIYSVLYYKLIYRHS